MTIRGELISPQRAAGIRRRLATHEAWAEQFRKPNGWTVITAEEMKGAPVKVSNEERGLLEQFNVWRDPPERLFCYVGADELKRAGSSGIKATVWTGHPLGFGHWSAPYRGGFNSERRSVSVIIAGYHYSGTAFVSSGDYARLKRGKRHHA